jgi:hypothetical protein
VWEDRREGHKCERERDTHTQRSSVRGTERQRERERDRELERQREV